MPEMIYIATCVANPLRWQTRISLARAAIKDWLNEPNVHITLAEVAYGSRGFDLLDLASDRVTHIPLHATTMAWSKECGLNIAINRMPAGSEKILALDADITFRRAGWATVAGAALDLYPVIQPWDTAYDLGPHDEHIQTHRSFASVWHAGKPVVANGNAFWSFNGGYNVYPHPGYAWGWQRRVLDRIGGLLEIGAMGSGDYHMALGIVGRYEASLPTGVSEGYKNAVASWATRAAFEVNGKLGFVHGTVEHPFHGRKKDRGYQTRWQMFLDSGFDPATDLKRNTYGVLEFSGAQPNLERAFDRYLRSREEDVNTLT
jgi:hypothetical protein